jgi:uncharacterized surface protein with fasciclin (FAS1) repeats
MAKTFFVLAFVALINTGCSPGFSGIMNALGNVGNLGTITNLIEAAGGLESLVGNLGKFTMLAPSDDALAKLGSDVLSNLTNPSNKSQLQDVLKNHILPGKLNLKDLGGLSDIVSAGGKELNMSGSGDDLTINGAKVTDTIKSGPGIIHVIDSVLN